MDLNVTLEGESTKRFHAIKAYYGLKNNGSLVADLLNNEADRIWEVKRIFITKETYKYLEKKAVAANLTVDEYVDQLISLLKKVEEAKEVEKHGKSNRN